MAGMDSEMKAQLEFKTYRRWSIATAFCITLASTASFAAEPASQGLQKSDVPLIDLGSELGIAPVGGAPVQPLKPEPSKHETKPAAKASNVPAVRFEKEQTAASSGKAFTPNDTKKMGHQHGAKWGYSGDGAPKYWGELASEFKLCKEGKNQSPIDLRDKTAVGTVGLPSLDIYYQDVPLKVINNGHTIQVNYPLGSYIKLGGKRYELLQFHFHTPSEHQKEGFNYPMEVHMVHKDGDGNLVVLGVIFREGEENEALNQLLPFLPKETGKEMVHRDAGLNPAYFLPGNQEFYKYSGSLTTPPCSEGVYWMVFKHPVDASLEQLQRMNEYMGENARPVQSNNARTTLKSWAEPLEETKMYEFY